jgi:hypothetical protein
MTKIINLDQLQTKRDKVVILGGAEHVMVNLTVKDYVHQLKQQAEMEKLATAPDSDPESADRVVELTVDILHKLFPTITKEQLEGLNLDQLNAMRSLAEGMVEEDAPEAEETGELTGKA